MADANVNRVSMTEKQKVKEITDKLDSFCYHHPRTPV